MLQWAWRRICILCVGSSENNNTNISPPKCIKVLIFVSRHVLFQNTSTKPIKFSFCDVMTLAYTPSWNCCLPYMMSLETQRPDEFILFPGPIEYRRGKVVRGLKRGLECIGSADGKKSWNKFRITFTITEPVPEISKTTHKSNWKFSKVARHFPDERRDRVAKVIVENWGLGLGKDWSLTLYFVSSSLLVQFEQFF